MSVVGPQHLAWLDRVARAVARHWLLLLNTFAVTYATLPWIAPLLQRAGFSRLGGFIFTVYSATCHQRPDRSFFIGGYQVCYCHRCTALYSSVAIVGLLYGLVRWRSPLSTRALWWASLPILVDGLWHMADDLLPGLGLRSTANGIGSVNFWARMLTGMLFGVAVVLWLYPRFARELDPVWNVNRSGSPAIEAT